MGTPGDKTSLGKVVRNLSAELDEVERGAPSTSQQTVVEKSTDETERYQEMTVLSRIPEDFIHNVYVDKSIRQQDVDKQITVKTETTAERLIPDATYFDNLTPFRKQTKALINLDLPGPSGLQTPKAQKPQLVTVKRGIKRSKKNPQGQQQQTPKRQHVCSVCQKSFQNSAKLSSHQQVHGGNNPFKCEHCKKTFSSKFKLVRHVLIHSDRKPFSCSVCERTFHRKDHLKNHVKVHSPSKKIYICPKTDCKKEYTSLLSFRKHSALHAAEEGSLDCKICLKSFESKEAILFHLKIHAGSRAVKNPNEKKFNCDFCDRKFFTRKDVRRHLVVHTGMRDFLCQFCPQRFGRKDHLVRHIKKSHSKLNIETTTETDIKIEPDVSQPDDADSQDLLGFKSESDFSELLFPQEFSQLSPMLSTEAFLSHTSTETDVKLENPILSTIDSAQHSGLSQGPSNLLVTREVSEDLLSEAPQGMTPSEIEEEFLRLFETSEDKNLPLPGFSQVFHPPS